MKLSKTIPSFRFQIALWTLVLSGAVLLGLTLFVYLSVHRQKLELLDTQLKAFANRLPQNPAGRGGMQRLEQAREWFFGAETVYLSVRDRDAQVVFRSMDWPVNVALPDEVALAPQAPHSSQAPSSSTEEMGFRRGSGPQYGQATGRQMMQAGVWRFQTLADDGLHWRLAMFSTANHEYRILVSLTSLDSEMAALRWQLTTVLLPALALLSAGGWIIAGRAIHPLNNISKAAEKIMAGQLEERIEPAEKAPEIGRIIALLNRMLDRLETNYRQALRFSADASHELKTPITLMQNSLVNHLNSVEAEGAEAQFCTQMLEHLSRIKRTTDGLLLLARTDSGQLPQSSQSFDMAELCQELCGDLRSLAEIADPESIWQESLPKTLLIRADPALTRTICFNLMVNAVRYSGHPQRIEVALRAEKNCACLRITNNGPAIPPEDTARIFNRFYRGANASHSKTAQAGEDAGSGLGLAIAHQLAVGMGGQLVLRHSHTDSTCFELTLPRADPET